MNFVPDLIDLAEFLGNTLYDAKLTDLIKGAENLNIKLTVRKRCLAHANDTCLHMQDHGFGSIEAARAFVHRQMEKIVFAVPADEAVRS